ncbi:hypothetical protein T4D_359 [Trichinella pseudospiralis]|uniref:Uncharacterized protein n=1 Tax=Trichinella pseudospiralis TaxID=6337 RepID=A0A0V1FRT3_TRIPS|nr:hypothetical protein T4D_359 [Trichinella pseudospiralis]
MKLKDKVYDTICFVSYIEKHVSQCVFDKSLSTTLFTKFSLHNSRMLIYVKKTNDKIKQLISGYY